MHLQLAQFFYNASAVGADSDLSESVLSAALRREMALTSNAYS